MKARSLAVRHSSGASSGTLAERYDAEYFAPYLERNLVGAHRGTKWFLNNYWSRHLRKRTRPGARILEVGCGLGFFASRVARDFPFVGLDISLTALSIARRQMGFRAFVCADAEALPCSDKTFDVVMAFDVIEHLSCPETFLAEAARVLRDSGLLILTTPNPGSFGATAKSRWIASDHVWFGYKDQTHISIRSIEEWRRAFAEGRFNILQDGTDCLWDPPYFARFPVSLQKLLFIGTQWIVTLLVGFLPWHLGENYVAILRKRPDATAVG